MYVCVSESEYGRNQRMGCHFLSVHNSLKSGCTCVHVYLFISTCIVYCAIETSVKQTSVGAQSAIGYVQKRFHHLHVFVRHPFCDSESSSLDWHSVVCCIYGDFCDDRCIVFNRFCFMDMKKMNMACCKRLILKGVVHVSALKCWLGFDNWKKNKHHCVDKRCDNVLGL